ncbi:MAG: uracil phosphoribosyltransferase [Lachnospirales bacterium]
MSELFVIEHPLVQSKLARLRSKDTNHKEFRELVGEVSTLLCYEATKDLGKKTVEVETPLGVAKCETMAMEIGVVTILRSGIGMVDGLLSLVPNAKVGHIGIYRDPNTFMPIEYYCKLPENIENLEVFVLEPMMATGGTASAAIQFLKERNAKNIKYICLICTPDGVKKLQQEHPDVDVYCAALDRQISDKGYIVPGLGDAGDRMFGTK